MKAIEFASFSLFALFIVTPGTNAQVPSKSIPPASPLIQKLQPVHRTYPGVSTDILGIQTGMTAAMAEAIAEKRFGNGVKPQLLHSHASLVYGPGNFTIQSRPFITEILFDRSAGIVADDLTLYFSSPVSGNRIWAMSRDISYYSASGQQQPPTVSSLEALLTRKYGPASSQTRSQGGALTLAWDFGPQNRVTCKTHDCLGGSFTMDAPAFLTGSGNNNDAIANNLLTPCGTTASYPNLFRIAAVIKANTSNRAQARDVTVSIWDASTCMNDGKGAEKQLMAAAVKYYKATYKAPPAPRL